MKFLLKLIQLFIINLIAILGGGLLLLLLLSTSTVVQETTLTTASPLVYSLSSLPISHTTKFTRATQTESVMLNKEPNVMTATTKRIVIPAPTHIVLTFSNTLTPSQLNPKNKVNEVKPTNRLTHPALPSYPPNKSLSQATNWLTKPPETIVSFVSEKELQPLATRANSVTIFQNVSLSGTIPIINNDVINEPTAANNGSNILYTGNRYAALSLDGGHTFVYTNPVRAFPEDLGEFCCDQVALYVPNYDLMLWLLLYRDDGTQNEFRLAVSQGNDIATNDWYYYDFESDPGTRFDYPDLHLSDNYLWITVDSGLIGLGTITSSLMYKVSLAEIKAKGTLYASKFDSESHGLSNLNFQATHGATQTMYWASHNGTSRFRLFSWAEDSDDVIHQPINLSPAWYKNFPVCPGPDGRDWCGRAYDGRMMTGWLSNGIIGFMWTSSQGGDFPYPYIEVVRVNEETKTLMDRPIIWSSNTAFAFPAVYPNARGELGFSMFMGGGNYYPTGLVGFNKDLHISKTITTTWELTAIASSSQGPTFNEWGDYVSVRPFSPLNKVWIATSYNLNGCGDSACVEPRLVVFGYEADRDAVECYLASGTCVFVPLILK